MNDFWMGHYMLGDVLGFCAAAHLYAAKTHRPVRVWFDPSRKAACDYFDGVVWTPREEMPKAVDCGGTPTSDEWPLLNGVSRFYRYMDPSLQASKSFDVHFNRPRPLESDDADERLIGLISHSNMQGDIPRVTLTAMLAEARRLYPRHRIGCFGNFDNTLLPEGVEDWRQREGGIGWIIDFVAKLSLLITPQSGPCFVAAGWRVPMWVYRSREPHWDCTLNYNNYRVTRWWDREPEDRFKVFEWIYQTGGWNGVGSGPGSCPSRNECFLRLLNQLIQRTPSIRSVLDIGCGDWQLMRHVDLTGKDYLGVDVAPSVIDANRAKHAKAGVEFRVLNPLCDDLPRVDLIIMKDVLAHLPSRDVAAMLQKIRRSSRFALLVDDFVESNQGDINLGEHRAVNVLAPPFDYPGVVIHQYVGKQVVLGMHETTHR